MKMYQNTIAKNGGNQTNKPGLRADDSILSSALRPGLGFVYFIIISLLGTLIINNLNNSNSASAASINLSIPNTLSLDISGASPSGTFAKSSTATVSTKTDSSKGYTLSIKSKDSVDSNCLKNGDNKIQSIESIMTEDQFRTSAAMNTWGYQPDKLNGKDNTLFLPGPTSSESVIDKTKIANNVLGSNYNIVLAAKVNTDLPAGTYKNTYVLTATSNALTYSVHYNNLEGSSNGPSPNPQTGQTEGNTVKLNDKTPAKEGFVFRGYCMVQPAEDGSCGTIVLQPGDTFALYCDENNIELWAIWDEPTMQEFSCSLLATVGNSATIKDARDGTMYTVAKLADQKCWMTDNLRIQNYTLKSTDSNVPSDFQIPASTDKPNSSNSYTSKELHIDSTYGGYYTWYTATAGEGTQSVSSGDVLHSICPKGWRLPTDEEYRTLNDALGGNTGESAAIALQATPNNFKMGGFYESGLARDVDTHGRYWSSTAYDSDRTYVLYFPYLHVNQQYEYLKFLLSSVRCVATQ